MLPSIAIHSLNNRSMFERREKGNKSVDFSFVSTGSVHSIMEMFLRWSWDWKRDAWCQIQFCLLQLWNLKIVSLEFGIKKRHKSYWDTCKLVIRDSDAGGCWEDVNLTYPIDNGIEQPWDEFLWIFDPILLNCHWISSFLLDLLAEKNYSCSFGNIEAHAMISIFSSLMFRCIPIAVHTPQHETRAKLL